MFTVTNQWIGEHATARGGWTKAQLDIIGVSWPPPKGWRRAVVGKKIEDIDRNVFETLGRDAAWKQICGERLPDHYPHDEASALGEEIEQEIRLALIELRAVRVPEKRDQVKLDAAIRRLEGLL